MPRFYTSSLVVAALLICWCMFFPEGCCPDSGTSLATSQHGSPAQQAASTACVSNNFSSRLGPKSEGEQQQADMTSEDLLTDVKVVELCTPAPPQEPCTSAQHAFKAANHTGVTDTSRGHRRQPKGCRKRSFLRAQRRATLHGGAQYRGRWFSAAELQTSHKPPQPETVKRTAALPQPTFRLRYMSWNCGGLHAARFQELKQWLRTQPPDTAPHVVMLQETWWPEDLEYTAEGWHVVHSASGLKGRSSAGVLTMISSRLATADMIRHSCVVPGRLQHLRINCSHAPGVQIDLVNAYQHSWALSSGRSGPNQADRGNDKLLYLRATFLATLQGLIRRLPVRNRLLIAGDFNAECVTSGSLVGKGLPASRLGRPLHSDQSTMQHLLEAEQLTALNTWGKSGNRALSFLHARTGGTLIDFALCRLSEADGVAKQAHMPLLPFVPPTGMRHKPVCGSIACSALMIRTSGRPNFCRQVQTAIQTVPGILAAFKVRLQQVLPEGQCCPTAQLKDKLQQAWQQVVQLRRSSRPSRPDSTASDTTALDMPVTECIIALWRLRRQCRQPLATQLGAFLQRWRLLAQHARLTRALHKHCRQRKRIKFDRLLSDAASSRGMTQLYKVVQRAAPKQSRRKLQLRDEQGMPQSAEQELQYIQGFYERLFESSPDQHAEQDLELTMPQFSTQEIQCALQGLPAGKALPSEYMPAILWKEAAEVVAPSMEQALRTCPGHGTLTLGPEWHTAQMCLMPKPGKPLKSVSDLRPIALLSPFAKSLAKMAANRLRPYVQRAVEALPLFAYISGRQAGDALDRVFSHCA